jgi:LPXTG-site transpeptidase (sortase) family protein
VRTTYLPTQKLAHSPSTKHTRLRVLLVGVLTAMFFVAIPSPAYAAEFTCDEAGLDAALAAGGGPHTFNCAGPTTITTTAQKNITRDVILDGEGLVTISGGYDHRVLRLSSGTNVELRNLTVTEGFVYRSDGPGIYNDHATLTLVGSTISNNGDFDVNNGGGIYNNRGTVTIINSMIANNYARIDGGGVFSDYGTLNFVDSTLIGNRANYSDGGGIYSNHTTIVIERSTIANNRGSDYSGGLCMNGGNATITNSTISGNSSRNGGGIVALSATLRVVNSTVTQNHGSYGGGIWIHPRGDIRFIQSILAGNTAYRGPNCLNGSNGDPRSVLVLDGYNLMGSTTYCIFLDTQPTDLVDVDPLLGPLADNGGLTQTHALLDGSPAIDIIPPAECTLAVDQRGVARPFGPMCDSGAFEDVQNLPPTADASGPYLVDEGSSVTLDGSGSTDPEGDPLALYEWDLDIDGVYDISSTNPTVTSGVYLDGPDATIIRLRVTDSLGLTDTDDALLTVNNVAPIVDTPVVIPEPSDKGEPVSASATFTDPGSDDSPFTCSVDYGDGSGLQPGTVSGNTCTGSQHVYGGNSSYTILVEITDKDGDTGSSTVLHQVNPGELPKTGFAPGLVTQLPKQGLSEMYQQFSYISLEIPSLGVKAPIVGIPLSQDGWNLTWLGDQAGWLYGTAFPSWAGNSALTAHVYNANGLPGPFHDLGRLMWGDELIVHAFGQSYIYEVREVERYIRPGDTSSVYRHEEYPWLTLITCKGYDEDNNSYRWRVIVRAVQTKID